MKAGGCCIANMTYAGPAATGRHEINPPQNGPDFSAATDAATTTNAVAEALTSSASQKGSNSDT
jgi:hypothetical protein